VSRLSTTNGFDRGSRRAAIVESLLADVFAGRLHAGQHLVTQDLAERFGVSHTPIREALIALAGSGIIDLLPNRGAVVCEVTAKEVREVCQVRRVLECEAVRRACGRIELKTLEKLAADFAQLAKRPDHSDLKYIERARALDSRLHDTIAAGCGNEFLARELTRLKTLFRGFRDVSWAYARSRNDFRRLAGEAREHLAIVQALLAGDSKAAARAMSAHIRSGVKYWTRALPASRAERNIAGNGRAAGNALRGVPPPRASGKPTNHDSNGNGKARNRTRNHHA
jgi:DNA-binding GntR family transcriptional regulator